MKIYVDPFHDIPITKHLRSTLRLVPCTSCCLRPGKVWQNLPRDAVLNGKRTTKGGGSNKNAGFIGKIIMI